MKRIAIVATVILVTLVIALLLLPIFTKPSGVSISGNLRRIENLKRVWQAAGGTNEWPTAAELYSHRAGFDRVSDGRALNERLGHRMGELYLINRTGAPPFAYVPETSELIVLGSNGLVRIRQ